MKKLLLVLCFLLPAFCFSQSMDDFFRSKGVGIVAECAHPTNTFVSGQFTVDDSYVWVRVDYKKRPTIVKIFRDGNWFTGIDVIEDDDPWMSPFGAIENIKDLAIDYIKNNSNQQKSKFEQRINKTIANMNGKELTCLALTLEWWSY